MRVNGCKVYLNPATGWTAECSACKNSAARGWRFVAPVRVAVRDWAMIHTHSADVDALYADSKRAGDGRMS